MHLFLNGIKRHYRKEINRCQSCGMPLIYDKQYLSGNIYCSYCHDGISFIKNNITLGEMQRKIDHLLLSKNSNIIIRIYMYLRLATLKRWRRL
ncbi:MAG: zinc ribbon domain-containing protein [Acidithiobacillus sp.]